MCSQCTGVYPNEELLASKAVKWLNDYFGDRDNEFFKVFHELPTLHFDDLLAGDIGDSTSCAVAYTVDSAIAMAYEPLRGTEESNYVKANGMKFMPEDVFVTVDGDAIDIFENTTNDFLTQTKRDVSIRLDAWVMDFIQAFDEGDCPSYDRYKLEEKGLIENGCFDYVGAVERMHCNY